MQRKYYNEKVTLKVASLWHFHWKSCIRKYPKTCDAFVLEMIKNPIKSCKCVDQSALSPVFAVTLEVFHFIHDFFSQKSTSLNFWKECWTWMQCSIRKKAWNIDHLTCFASHSITVFLSRFTAFYGFFRNRYDSNMNTNEINHISQKHVKTASLGLTTNSFKRCKNFILVIFMKHIQYRGYFKAILSHLEATEVKYYYYERTSPKLTFFFVDFIELLEMGEPFRWEFHSLNKGCNSN